MKLSLTTGCKLHKNAAVRAASLSDLSSQMVGIIVGFHFVLPDLPPDSLLIGQLRDIPDLKDLLVVPVIDAIDHGQSNLFESQKRMRE